MKPLDKKERAELKKLTRRIRTHKATQREFLRAISLTNRDHAQVRFANREIDRDTSRGTLADAQDAREFYEGES